jgi:hypothetical protein
MLHKIDGGLILHEIWHPQLGLNAHVDLLYYLPFITAKHKAIMGKDMDLSQYWTPISRRRFIASFGAIDLSLMKKGVFVPVKHYKCYQYLQHTAYFG